MVILTRFEVLTQGVDEDKSIPLCYDVSSGNPKNSVFIFRVKQFKERDYFL